MEDEASASRIELGQMNRDFAAVLNAKDAKAAAALYTEDAVLIPPEEPIVRGRAAIESGGIREVSVETMDAQSSGSLGYETGSFVLTVDGPDGEPIIDRGRYVELLRREADGTRRPSKEHRMAKDGGPITDGSRGLYTLAMVNTAIWAIAIVALLFVIQHAPSAKGLFVILAGGTGVSISLLARLGKPR